MFLTAQGVTLALAQSQARLSLDWVGANGGHEMTPESELGTRVNYLVGSDPTVADRRSDVRPVRCHGVYPQVDVVFYDTQRELEYDFLVHPGADASAIGWAAWRDALELSASGDLEVTLADVSCGC